MRVTTGLRALWRDLRGIRTEPRTDKEHLDAAIEWLYHSQDVTDCDGSAAYYSLVTGWAGPYPETSGYIVPTLYEYASETDSPEARRRATRMAEWLLTTQLDSGAFPGGSDPGPDADPNVFNTGQILFGLVRAFRETDEERFLTAAERAGEWLVEVQHAEGYWDRFDYRGERHSYCSRVAWALLELHEVTGGDAFRDGAVAHLEWVLSVQTETDWFEYAAFSPDERPYLHTIAYTVRGLLEGGFFLNDERFVDAATATADRLLAVHEDDGILRGVYDRNWNGRNFYCLPGNAQMALVWLRLSEHSGESRYLDGATEEIEFLKTHHRLDGPAAVRGALKGSHPVWGSYMQFRYPNWAAKFLCDCLLTHSQIR
jgi:uncharacterized protein YyaL (SSP411 family)